MGKHCNNASKKTEATGASRLIRKTIYTKQKSFDLDEFQIEDAD